MHINPLTADAQVEFDSFGLPNDPDDEFDPMFQDFVESISLTKAELAVFLAMPHASVAEVRRMFAARRSRDDNPRRARRHRRSR